MQKNSIVSPLTSSQLEEWHKNGFLILRNVLEEKEVSSLLKAVDKVISLHEEKTEKHKNTTAVHGKEYFNIHNPFDYTKNLDFLLDYPKTFDVITYLMGPYIQAMSCHIFVRHPSSAESTNIGKFHTDSGPALQRILPISENLALQIKAQFFLTDMTIENASNFIAIPGSHVRRVNYHHPYCLIPECNKYLDQGQIPPEAVQLRVKAGDVLFHALSLWHAVAPNKSLNTRRSVSIRYGQMWFKDYYFKTTKRILKRMTPRQRRLLGDFGDHVRGDIAYRPPDDHVPLMLGDKASDYGWSMDWINEEKNS